MLLAFILALLGSPASAETPRSLVDQFILRDWDTRDGLPQNTVTSIIQTNDGYLWLGTFGGLVRFDGQAFTVFEPENTPGLSSARIVTLFEDRHRVLWVGTESGLTRYDRGRFASFTIRDGLPHDRIMAVYEDAGGRLWVGTGNGVARFDGHRFETIAMQGLEQTALAFAQTPNGDVWIATVDGIARVSGDGAQAVVQRSKPVPSARLFVDSRGRLWFGADRLQRWDGDRFIDVPAPPSITALTETADGTIWIATWQSGVLAWRDSAVQRYADANLASTSIRTIAADRDGNLWLGTDVNGLIRLRHRQVFSFERPGANSQSLGPIVGDGNGGLWIGATCGGLLHFAAGAFRTYGLADGLPNDCVWALHRDPDGTLWLGTMGGGLTRYANGTFTSWGRSEGLPTALVSGINRARDGALWLATDLGVTRFADGRFTSYSAANGVPPGMLTIAQDRAGTMWFGGLGGLTRFADGRFTTYTTAQGLSNNHVRAIYEDADGVLWIGTYGGGLNRYAGGRFTAFTTKNGLHDNAVSRIIEDDRGNMWMSGNKGIFRVARRQLNDVAEGRASSITSVSYGMADGMIIDETNGGQPAGWRTPDGRLWFPTIKGLVGIESAGNAAAFPPIFVEHTITNGRDAEFHFTAVDLGAAEKTRFRYRLDGYDRAWIDSDTRRVAYYTNLPPGQYHFQVAATNSDGAWSDAPGVAAIAFAPFWWERRGVQIAALALLLVFTGFGVRWLSLRRARARVAELLREQAIDRERSRIARDLHDDLGSRLSHIAFMASRGHSGDGNERLAAEARSAVQTMDELVWAVNARNDTVESFAYYVAHYAEEHVGAAGLRCRLALPPELPAQPLAADTRRHIFLAFKEAINNALKHAQASELRISLEVGPNTLTLEVADNGRGLSAEAMDPTGNGLGNLEERMELVGGTVAVASTPGQGTRITFAVPIAGGAHLHAMATGESAANTRSRVL